jgi:hypothetical protein
MIQLVSKICLSPPFSAHGEKIHDPRTELLFTYNGLQKLTDKVFDTNGDMKYTLMHYEKVATVINCDYIEKKKWSDKEYSCSYLDSRNGSTFPS